LLLLLLFLVRSGMAPGTSYLRYRGEYILPATHLPYGSLGPAVWRVAGPDGLCAALTTLLREPLERRSRGQAAAQVRGDPRRGSSDELCALVVVSTAQQREAPLSEECW
jgi:hypothetical protein